MFALTKLSLCAHSHKLRFSNTWNISFISQCGIQDSRAKIAHVVSSLRRIHSPGAVDETTRFVDRLLSSTIVKPDITIALFFFLFQVDEAEMARRESRWGKGEGEALAGKGSYGEKLGFPRQKGTTCCPPFRRFARARPRLPRRGPL